MFRLPRPQNLGVIQNSYYLKIEKESVAGPAFSASVELLLAMLRFGRKNGTHRPAQCMSFIQHTLYQFVFLLLHHREETPWESGVVSH